MRPAGVEVNTRGWHALEQKRKREQGRNRDKKRKRERPRGTVKSANGTLVVFTSPAIDRSRGSKGMARGNGGVGGGWTSRYFICH